MSISICRPLVTAAGLVGAIGVAAAAYASHGSNEMLGIAANFLLFHAAALIAIGILPGRPLRAAGGVIFLGVALFAGDLAMAALQGHSLFPFAAPAGGTLMILGWLGLSLAALLRRTPAAS